MINQWDVWFAEFPFEDTSGSKDRPVIVLNVEPLEVLSVKVTTHAIRNSDEFDIPISRWSESGLKGPSVARVSKTTNLSTDNFRRKLGVLHEDDREPIMRSYINFIND
jgi:hypothetical protein